MAAIVDRSPTYKKGGRVKKTGMAKLHEGEVVLKGKSQPDSMPASTGWNYDSDEEEEKALLQKRNKRPRRGGSE